MAQYGLLGPFEFAFKVPSLLLPHKVMEFVQSLKMQDIREVEADAGKVEGGQKTPSIFIFKFFSLFRGNLINPIPLS